jgi:hypothetical protein
MASDAVLRMTVAGWVSMGDVSVLAAVLGAWLAASAPPRALVVRASDAAAACVEAAGRAADPARPRFVLNVGPLEGDADLFVGSAPAVTRVIEAGIALDATETDVARIPWVLSVAPGALPQLRSLGELRERDVLVGVPAGPEFVEGRRAALAALPGDRVVEVDDPRALRSTLVALAPLSLAPPGRRIAVDVPPLVVRGAVSARAKDAAGATSFLRFLAEAAGERAASVCGPKAAAP